MESSNVDYLSDEFKESDESKFSDDLSLRRKKTLVLFFSFVGIVLLAGFVLVISSNFSSDNSKKIDSKSDKSKKINKDITPTVPVEKARLEGEVKCSEKSELKQVSCSEYLLDTGNEKYSLKNINYTDIELGNIKDGNKIKVSGNKQGKDLYLSTIKVESKKEEPKKEEKPTPTVYNTPTPTPTPIPHFKDSTPLDGVTYVTVKYIKDNADVLSGKTVNVGAYLVGGSIGQDGCKISGICEYSVFTLADSNDPDTGISDSIEMRGNSSEKEEDYTTGQNYYHQVVVVLEDNKTRLDKKY